MDNEDVESYLDDDQYTERYPDNPDDVTSLIIGGFGWWQFKISFLMSLMKFSNAWYQLSIMFMAPDQEFWCTKPESFKRYSTKEWRRICKPLVEEFPCLIFDPEVLAIDPDTDKSLVPLVKCPKFEYDTSTFKRTIIADWNLVCEDHWRVHVTRFVIIWGILVGGLIFGILADKYGRRNPLMLAIVIQCTSSFIVSMAPTFELFLVNWFLLALACGGIAIVSLVICIESVSGKWRTIVPILFQLPFGLGTTVMAGLAYWFRDWRKLEFALATLSSLHLLYWFYIPESPRWLLANGQVDKAAEILKKAAAENKRKWSISEIRRMLPKHPHKKSSPGFIMFMKSRKMRYRTLLLAINWFCIGLSFYTFSQLLGEMGSNIFLCLAVIGLISTTGPLLCVVIVTRLGRRVIMCMFQILISLCFILMLLIPGAYSNSWYRILLAGTGFAGMGATVPIFYLYTGELFPTVGRNVGVGGVTMFARLGSMAAPVVVMLESYRPNLPLMLLAAMSVAQIFLLLPLPETKNKALPVTVQDAEVT